jgi:hypothetical protein
VACSVGVLLKASFFLFLSLCVYGVILPDSHMILN